MVTSTTA